MNNLYLFLVLLLLVSCKTKTTENSGGIQITLSIENNNKSDSRNIEHTIQVLQSRMEFFCGDHPTVTLDSLKNEIIIKLPNQDKSKLPIFMELISAKGKLRIMETHNLPDFYRYLEAVNTLIVEDTENRFESFHFNHIETDELEQKTSKDHEIIDGLFIPKEEDEEEIQAKQYPLLQLITLPYDLDFQPVIGYCNVSDTAKINALLKMDIVTAQFPFNAVFHWGKFLVEGKISLFAAKTPLNNDYEPITTEMIEYANFSHNAFDESSSVTFKLHGKHYDYWTSLTRKNLFKALAIIIDDVVYSCPIVQGVMTDGYAQITGEFNKIEASVLTAILNSGELKNNLTIKKVDVTPLK